MFMQPIGYMVRGDSFAFMTFVAVGNFHIHIIFMHLCGRNFFRCFVIGFLRNSQMRKENRDGQ